MTIGSPHSPEFPPPPPPPPGSRPPRARLSSGALQRLDIGLRMMPFADVETNTELRDAVRDQVQHLRSQGEPPERVLVEIKRELAESLTRTAGVGAAGTTLGDEQDVRTVIDQVVRWCIEAYYRAD